MAKSTRKPRSGKAADFPLTRGARYWCKKIKVHMFYFGKVADDPKGERALNPWLD